jgi:hypothetical protein
VSILAKAYIKCLAGNKVPVVSDDILSAWMRLLLGEEQDPGFKRFWDFWFTKSPVQSKKQHVGRQHFLDLFKAHKHGIDSVSEAHSTSYNCGMDSIVTSLLGTCFPEIQGKHREV